MMREYARIIDEERAYRLSGGTAGLQYLEFKKYKIKGVEYWSVTNTWATYIAAHADAYDAQGHLKARADFLCPAGERREIFPGSILGVPITPQITIAEIEPG